MNDIGARELLTKAAFTAFLAHGYDGAGITQILAGTRLSKGAFYHHFESKMALFELVMTHYFPNPLGEIDWEDHGRGTIAEQQAAIKNIYNDLSKSSAALGDDLRRYFTLFFDGLSRLPKFSEQVDAGYARLINSLADAYIAEEKLTPGDANAKARAYIAGFEGQFYLWAVLRHHPGKP
jgi:AcrR family transcriptional regulator